MMFFVALFEDVTIWEGFLDRETKYVKSVHHIAIPFHTLCSIIVPTIDSICEFVRLKSNISSYIFFFFYE